MKTVDSSWPATPITPTLYLLFALNKLISFYSILYLEILFQPALRLPQQHPCSPAKTLNP